MKQLNQKTPLVFRLAIVLLCCLLVSSHLLSGLYARYTSTASATSVVRVAKFDQNIQSGGSEYSKLAVNIKKGTIFAVIDSFVVENTGDVTFEYALKLKLSEKTGSESYDAPSLPSHMSFQAPVRANGVRLSHIRMTSDNTRGEIVTMDFAAVCGGKTYTAGKIYYAYSDNGVDYTWVESNSAEMNGVLKPSAKRYYKIVYFLDWSENIAAFTSFTPASVLYSITCDQVD